MILFNYKEQLSIYRLVVDKVYSQLAASLRRKVKFIQHIESSKGAKMTENEYKRIKQERAHIDLVIRYYEITEDRLELFEKMFFELVDQYGEEINESAAKRERIKLLEYMLAETNKENKKWLEIVHSKIIKT